MVSQNVKQTINIASKFAKSIKTPCIILLEGDLGAGKTHFVKGFAKGYASKQLVTSPTFTIMNIYQGKKPIYHFDLYRLESEEEAEILGFEEYFNHDSLNGVTLVEWPEKAKSLVKDWDYKVQINKIDEDKREIVIQKRG